MATLTDNPEFSANEIYEITQTDPCEGAGEGASFGGIGIHNQPHQQLANRTALLYQRQQTNIASIAAINAFVSRFAGLLSSAGTGVNGGSWVALPFTDQARGAAKLIVQWGLYAPAGGIGLPANYTISLPTTFPNAMLGAIAIPYFGTSGAAGNYVVALSVGAFSVVNFQVAVGDSKGNAESIPGVVWLSVGF